MEQPTKSLFEIFAEFSAVAPKNLGELKALANEYRKLGKHDTADWIDEWVENHVKHYKEEWEVDDAPYA